MNDDLALTFLKDKFSLTLTETEEKVFSGSWKNMTYTEIATEFQLSESSIRHYSGPKLWKKLSEHLGETITKDNLKTAIERKYARLQLVNTVQDDDLNTNIDWGEAPNTSRIEFFDERKRQLEELKELICNEDRNKNYQLVALTGLKGIGKTTFAVKFLEKLDKKKLLGENRRFNSAIWRSLSYDYSSSSDRSPQSFEKILGDIIGFLSQDEDDQLKVLRNDDGKLDVNGTISLLIDYMNKKPCLLVLDSVESLMENGGSKDGPNRAGIIRKEYEQYRQLFTRVGQERHKSCLLLITSEKPVDIIELEQRSLPVYSYHLKGLEKDGQEILQEILKANDLKANDLSSDDNENSFKELIELFSRASFCFTKYS